MLRKFPSPVGSRTLRGSLCLKCCRHQPAASLRNLLPLPPNPQRGQLPAEEISHRVPRPPSPTFLVAFGFRHRAATTCGGRRGCLLGPRRRGGLWDGPQELPSGVPDKTCAVPSVGHHLRSSPRFQVDFSRVWEPPNPERPTEGFACRSNSMVPQRQRWQRGACRIGSRRGPGSHHGGGGGGLPVLALGNPSCPCGRGLRRPSGQIRLVRTCETSSGYFPSTCLLPDKGREVNMQQDRLGYITCGAQ